MGCGSSWLKVYCRVQGLGLIYEGGFIKLFPGSDRGCREGSVTVTKGATTVDEVFYEDSVMDKKTKFFYTNRIL